MTQAGIELVRAERRRRWTRAEKERLVAASFEPGCVDSDVARRAGLPRQSAVPLAQVAVRACWCSHASAGPRRDHSHVRRDDGRA